MTDDGNKIHQDIGRLEGQMAAVMAQLALNSGELKKIQATLSEAKGGWKTVMLIAGVAGSVGAILGPFVTKILPFTPFR